jgi:mono/diheme cytochrome c family protein
MILFCGVVSAADKSERTIILPDDNAMAALKTGPGADVTTANCAICHSTDYIVRQPGSDAKHWETEVRKMVTVFGAQISDEDVKVIVDYLASAFGPQAKTDSSPVRRRPVRPRRIVRNSY